MRIVCLFSGFQLSISSRVTVENVHFQNPEQLLTELRNCGVLTQSYPLLRFSVLLWA